MAAGGGTRLLSTRDRDRPLRAVLPRGPVRLAGRVTVEDAPRIHSSEAAHQAAAGEAAAGLVPLDPLVEDAVVRPHDPQHGAERGAKAVFRCGTVLGGPSVVRVVHNVHNPSIISKFQDFLPKL